MTLLSYLAMAFGSVMGFAAFPQTYRIFKRKSAKDISVITFMIYAIGGIIWILYGFEIKNIAIIVPNLIGVSAAISVVTGWFLYRR